MPRPLGTKGGHVVHPDWCANNRPAAESVLEDRCTITRAPTAGPGQPVMNLVTGQKVRTPVVVATDLACRVSYASTTPAGERGAFAEETVDSATHLVQLPLSHTDIKSDDLITITCATDAKHEGRRFQVLKDGTATYSWTRLVRCESVQ